MVEYADTMSEICEIRAYEEGRLRAFYEIATFIAYKYPLYLSKPVVEINKEIERQIEFTKEVIKEWEEEE